MTGMRPPLPTADQAAWQDMEQTLFVHFDPAVYANTQGGGPDCPLDRIRPNQLDTDQWVDVARSYGARMVIFTAKHAGGFAWWQTRTTNYGVKELAWRDGKGDVLKMLSESCRQAGLALGVYLSPADAHLDIGVGAKAKTSEQQEAYRRIYRQQLEEVLTRYGEILEVWFDGSLAFAVGDILKHRAPHAVIFQSESATIRWIGNESGIAPYPTWNAVRNAHAVSGVATACHSTPEGDVWLPVECDTTIRGHEWFWNEGHDHLVKPLDTLMDVYYRSVGYGGVLLLNANPDRRGLVPDADAKRTAEFGDAIRARFDRPLAETRGEGNEVTLDFGRRTRLDHVVVMEDIRRGGERMRSYVLEGFDGTGWKCMASGSAIGHKKIDAFPAIETERIRIRTLQSAGTPLIRRLAAYAVGSVPARKGPASEQVVDVAAWGPDTFRPDDAAAVGRWTDPVVEREYDVSFACDRAGQYRVEFARESGTDEINVEPICMVSHGRPYPEWIQGRRDARSFGFSLPGVGGPLHVRVRLNLIKGTDFYGQVRVWRA